jgi:putative bacteriocin precursor
VKKLRKKVLLSNDTVEAFTLPCPCGCSCRCAPGFDKTDDTRNESAYVRYENKMDQIEP